MEISFPPPAPPVPVLERPKLPCDDAAERGPDQPSSHGRLRESSGEELDLPGRPRVGPPQPLPGLTGELRGRLAEVGVWQHGEAALGAVGRIRPDLVVAAALDVAGGEVTAAQRVLRALVNAERGS